MGPFEPQVWQVLHSTVNILHVPTPIQAFMHHGQSFSELPGNHNDAMELLQNIISYLQREYAVYYSHYRDQSPGQSFPSKEHHGLEQTCQIGSSKPCLLQDLS